MTKVLNVIQFQVACKQITRHNCWLDLGCSMEYCHRVSFLPRHLPPNSFHSLILLPYSLWDIECGACLRVLEGHEELVRCIRFDTKRIVSGAYDGLVNTFCSHFHKNSHEG